MTDAAGMYEHNLVLSHVLQQLGFRVRGLAARVLWNVPEGIVRPRSHMLLLIDLESRHYVADVGFGGLTLTAPLRLQVDIEQTTPHEVCRLIAAGDGFVMQAKVDDNWRSRATRSTCRNRSWKTTKWSIGTSAITLLALRYGTRRRTAGSRVPVHASGNELAVHHMNGGTERRLLTSTGELRAALEDTFRVILPEGPELEAALERVICVR